MVRSALSESVSPALEVIGLHKRFAAGAGSCFATNAVLRGVDLELDRGEVAAIVGQAGSGRSTLLLCIAGLLSTDQGLVRRFGDESREAAGRCTRHYLTYEQLERRAELSGPTLHLVDLHELSALEPARLRHWLTEQSGQDYAALVVADSVELASQFTSRILVLRDGRLHGATRVRARVAESRFVDRPFERV